MTTSYRPVVRSQSDLEAVWKHLMGLQTSDRGFGGHSLWLVVIDADDRPFPQITEITEAVEPPDDEMISSIATFLDGLADRWSPLRVPAFAARSRRPDGR